MSFNPAYVLKSQYGHVRAQNGTCTYKPMSAARFNAAYRRSVTPLETCWSGNDIRRFKEFDSLLSRCLSDNVIRAGIGQPSQMVARSIASFDSPLK